MLLIHKYLVGLFYGSCFNKSRSIKMEASIYVIKKIKEESTVKIIAKNLVAMEQVILKETKI